MRSRVRVISAIGCAWVIFVALGCVQQLERPKRGGGCEPNEVLICPCADGRSEGFTTCGNDAYCGGCPAFSPAPTGTPQASAPAHAAGSGAANGGAAAGSFAPPPASQGSASAPALPGSAAGAPSVGVGCAAGETCKPAAAGSAMFCTPNPAATVPPTCTAAGTPCGTNSNGTCVDAATLGVPGALYCVYDAC